MLFVMALTYALAAGLTMLLLDNAYEASEFYKADSTGDRLWTRFCIMACAQLWPLMFVWLVIGIVLDSLRRK